MLKLYEVEFEPMWPVPNGLILLANNEDEAREIAIKTIKHTKPISIREIPIDAPKVVFYESGDY